MFVMYFRPMNYLGDAIKYNHIPICFLVDFSLMQKKNFFFNSTLLVRNLCSTHSFTIFKQQANYSKISTEVLQMLTCFSFTPFSGLVLFLEIYLIKCFVFLTLPLTIPDEKKKLSQIFIFTPLCGASKGFMKALKALNLLRHHKEVWK